MTTRTDSETTATLRGFGNPRKAGASAFALLRETRALLRRERKQGWAALNDLFRAGKPPPSLDGFYRGQFVALDIAPGLTQAAEWLAARWMPWLGKRFVRAESAGDNLVERAFYWPAHLIWPYYRRYSPAGAPTGVPALWAFRFHTAWGPGLADPDRRVLRLDYDLPLNPRLSVRRILDELVQVDDGSYLGKAHVHWWWGRWQLVAYFTLLAMTPKDERA
jgi:hypothetical protein